MKGHDISPERIAEAFREQGFIATGRM